MRAKVNRAHPERPIRVLLIAAFYEAGKVVAVVCHGTCLWLETRLATGELLVRGTTWTGFAASEMDD